MEASKCQERAGSRFEKMVRFYWDGVPIPPFVIREGDILHRTFTLKQLNYSPDYYGEVKELPLVQEEWNTKGFLPLSRWEKPNPSITCRIGSHHSPFIGLFRFSASLDDLKIRYSEKEANEKKKDETIIRIPADPCDLPEDFDDEVRWQYRKFIRTKKLLELYVPIVKEFCPITNSSLRRIVILATEGISPHKKEYVVRETLNVKDEYTRWMCRYVFYYMCGDPLFSKILSPLQLLTRPEPVPYQIITLNKEERAATQASFAKARKSLMESIVWKNDTRSFFLALRTLWNSRLRRLVFFDLTTKDWITDAESFGRQLRTSLRSAFTRIRIEFYSYAEEFFFTYVLNAKSVLQLNEADLANSVFQRIFTGARLFLVEQVRRGLFEGLEKVVEFFSCFGNYKHTCRITKRMAKKYPLIGFNLVVGEISTPRAPDFSNLVALFRSLFDEFLEKLAELPRIEYVFLPTLNFKKEPIEFLTEAEVACYRSSLMEICEQVELRVDTVSALYANFTALPCRNTLIAAHGDSKEIQDHIAHLREKYYAIGSTSSDTVFCGRFAIRCSGLKRYYSEKWEGFLLKFYDELHRAAMSVIDKAEERCMRAQQAIHQTPTTVAELEVYLVECTAAQALAESLKVKECQDIIQRICCMEDCQVPIENFLYIAAEKLMNWPHVLQQDLAASELIKERCRPVLKKQVEELRLTTRYQIRSIDTGLIELYNVYSKFNLETCNIAVETCMLLNDLVEATLEAIDQILHQEEALGLPSTDTFDDLYPLINYVETIGQFWTTVDRSTTLQEYYSSPVSSLNMKIVETVREWRRLIHCSTRNLRGYPALVRLGQEQEAALARFEALEEFISLITTPGLRKNHWKEIARLLASKLQDDVALVTDMSISLQRLLDADILSHMPELTRIVSQARSDFEVESVLEQMKSSAKKIHFQVEIVQTSEYSTRPRVTDESHTTVLSQVESYIRTCRNLRWKTGLSGVIMRALNEWEAATEKTRDMLLEWRRIEEQWAPLHNYLVTVQKAQKKERKVELVPVFERLTRCHDAFHQLHVKIGKPQFSLYMAIVQETVMEHLTVAKTALGELKPFLGDVLEKKRVAFPRFNFITDEQLITFLSAYNIPQLKQLLPHMYARLGDIEVKHNCIVSYTTIDGSTIKANPVVPLKDSLKREWIVQFDQSVSRSVFSAVKECFYDFGKGPLEAWVDAHCPQMLSLGLRAVHTKRMRHALSFSGLLGLRAYQVQLKNLREELCRLCGLTHDAKKRDKLGQVLSYLFNAELDVATGITKKISSLSELDGTTMIQTFIEEQESKTRILGVDFVNGQEFYGSLDSSVVMTPEIVERMIILMVLTLMGKATPMVCGPKRRFLPLIVVSIIGRFFIPIQCFHMMKKERLSAFIRGAVQIGAALCFHDTERLDPEVRTHLHDVVEQVTSVLNVRGRRDEVSMMLPLGPDGTTVPTPIHRQFHAMFTCKEFERLPRTIAFESRPIMLPHVNPSSIIRGYLYTFGYPNEISASLQFGYMYELFHRTRPTQFTMRILVLVIKNAADTGDPDSPMVVRLCESFVRLYYTVLKEDDTIQKLFFHCVTHVLGLDSAISTSIAARLCEVERPNTHQVYSRFSDLMCSSRRVIIAGAAFSGKTKVWKRWVGSAPYFVFSPSLISASDLFGTSTRRGLLATMGKRKNLSSPSFCIVDGGAYLRQAFWAGIEDFSRILVGEQAYIVGNASIIITTRRLHQMDPSVCSIFSQFNMEITYTWQRFLRKCLTGAPHQELANDVMEIVLGSIFQCIREDSNGYLALNYDEEQHLLAASQRCANLYKKWHENSKSNFELCGGDEELMIDERAFAAQCAILSASWGTGLGLSNQEKPIIEKALINADVSLGELMESYDITARLLPPVKDNTIDIFNFVSTPCGWKTFREATSFGYTYPWSSHKNLNPQQPAWTQVFELPSRANAIRAAECLIDCGENVILCGAIGSGKSTLLRTTRFCDRWLPRAICCSKGANPTSIQENICSRLTRRSNDVYGPQIGRKLVICIDDIHLTTVLEEGLPVAAQIMAFCTKFNAITTPKEGFLPIQDVVFCATMNQQKLHATVTRGCVEIFLPPLDGDELAAGLWELFEGCCAKKRVELFPRQAAAFITIAHSYYVRVANHLELPERMAYISGYDTLLRQSLELLPGKFRDALRASDIIRTNLLTNIPDVQVVSNVFKYVDELYTAKLLAECPEGVLKFRENLVHVAEVTLGICTQEVLFKDLVHHDEILFESATSAMVDTVTSWISMMENNVHLMKTNLLENVMNKAQAIDPCLVPENSNRSIFISYPSLMSSGNKVVLTPQSQPRKGSARVRSARHTGPTAAGIVSMSHTYHTTWLVTHANFLAKALRHEDMHFVFTTKENFGCKRLLRLVCCAACLPLALFRAHGTYTFELFKRELKAAISYGLLNDTGVVAYIPYGILKTERVAWMVDTIIRTGEISELYSEEEMTALAKGYHLTQRSLRQLTLLESLELRRRVQHCLHFILHVDSPSILHQYAEEYPSMRHLFAMSLHTPSSDATLRLQLAQGILSEQDYESSDSREDFERKFGSNGEVARLICLVYDEVSSSLPTKGEQLIEFTHLVRKFRHTMIQRIQHNAHMANVVSNHGYKENDESDIAIKLKENNNKLAETQSTAEAAKMRLSEEQNAISQHEQLYQEETARLKHEFNTALHALRKAKGQAIRNLSQSRVPEKGTLLVKAVYRTLGEELPPYGSKAELWNQGTKVMCKSTFIDTMCAIRPEQIQDANALLVLQQDLSEVRYTGTLSFAQTIADFILAIMGLLRHREEGMDNKLKNKKDLSQTNLHALMSKAENAKQTAEKTAESIRSLEKICDEIRQSQSTLEEREVMLSRFVTLVDKFAEFVVAIDSRAIDCVEGDIILVAAIFSLLIMHRDMENSYQQLQRVLLERGIRTTLRWENAVKHLLFPGQSRQVDSFVSNGLPRRHRMVLYMLMARAHWRWPLIGGVCDCFEESLREFLSFECSQCVVVSAFDPNAKSEILHALKDGAGLIVRDVVDVSTVNLVRPLHVVLQRINELRMRPNNTEKKFSVILYGKEIEVDIRFLLVCTSTPLIPNDHSSPMTQWFHVVNLFMPLSRPYRYERLLFRAPTVKNLAEDIINKRQLLYDEIFSFIRSYDTATHLISEDFAKEDPAKLRHLEEVINELTLHYGLISQYVGQLQAMTKQQRDAWIPVEGAVKRSSLILRFIEFNKLERPWNDMALDAYVRNMCHLPPHLVARISPQIFAEISMPEKHFYAIVNFLERVVRGFNNGWPHMLRSIFALLLVAGVTSNSDEIILQRGYLFPAKMEMLNAEQVDVVKAILSDETLEEQSAEKDEAKCLKLIEASIRELYENSEDPLLAAVAEDRVSGDDGLVEGFFVALLDFQMERAGKLAEQMVNGFFQCVRDSKWMSGDSGGGRQSEEEGTSGEGHGGGTGHMGGVVLPPLRNLHSEADLFIQAVENCIPICIGTHYYDSGLILRRLPNYAQINHLFYRWFHVSSVADLKPLPQIILQSFYESHPNTKGTCLTLHLDLPESMLEPYNDLPLLLRDELRMLIEELSRTLAAYNGRRNCVNYDSKNVQVCVILVVSYTAHNVLWGNNPNVHIPLLRCLYFNRVFVTPQRHLLDLLNTHPRLHVSNWERMDRGKSPHMGGRSAISTRSYDSGDGTSTLESMALLMAKELAIIHIAMAQRIRMTQANWRVTHLCPFPLEYERQLMNDENLTLLLQLLKGWIQWTDGVMDEREQSVITFPNDDSSGIFSSPNASRGDGILSSKSPLGMGHRFRQAQLIAPEQVPLDQKPDIQTQVANIFGMQDNRERHAYAFYRQQLRAWSGGLEAPGSQISTLATSSPAPQGSPGVLSGGMHTANASYMNPMAEESAMGHEDPIEALELQLSTNIFNTFQKLASEVLSCYGLSKSESKALQWLLRKVVVAPSSSAVVSCHFTDLPNRCPLLLDADTDFRDFELEVAELPSDLIELCGDGHATMLYRATIAQQARALFFRCTRAGREGTEELTPTTSQAREHYGGGSPATAMPRPQSSSPVGAEHAAMEVRAQSSGMDRRKRVSAVLSPELQQLRPTSSHRPTSSAGGGISLRPPQTEWRHDFDSLRHSHLTYKSSDRELLSKYDLVNFDEIESSHSAWLKPLPLDPPLPKGQAATEVLPWMVEKDHAMNLLQFYTSSKSHRPDWEREFLFNTYRCLATQSFIRDKIVSVWVPAMSNPSVTLDLVATAVHQKLATLMEDDDYELQSDWLETKVHDWVLVVTQRQLLCAGDVVLSRAHLSPSLQRNVRAITGWEEEWFKEAENEFFQKQVNCSPMDVVIAVRLMEVKRPPPDYTIAMLEAPTQRTTGSKVWPKPQEVVVRTFSEQDARAFTWAHPQTATIPLTTSGGNIQRRESWVFEKRLSTAMVVSQPMFFTSLEATASRRKDSSGRERQTFHMLSSTPVNLFYESRELGKFKKEDIKLSGEPLRKKKGNEESLSDLVPPPRTLLDTLLAEEAEDSAYAFAIEKKWRSVYPRPLCIIWEKEGQVTQQTTLDIPKDGLSNNKTTTTKIPKDQTNAARPKPARRPLTTDKKQLLSSFQDPGLRETHMPLHRCAFLPSLTHSSEQLYFSGAVSISHISSRCFVSLLSSSYIYTIRYYYILFYLYSFYSVGFLPPVKLLDCTILLLLLFFCLLISPHSTCYSPSASLSSYRAADGSTYALPWPPTTTASGETAERYAGQRGQYGALLPFASRAQQVSKHRQHRLLPPRETSLLNRIFFLSFTDTDGHIQGTFINSFWLYTETRRGSIIKRRTEMNMMMPTSSNDAAAPPRGWSGRLSRSVAMRRLYAAETPLEGYRAMYSFFPPWFPPVALLSLTGLYGVWVCVRIKYTRWRIAERRRAERAFEVLENLRGLHAMNTRDRGLHSHALAEEDGDDDEEEEEGQDETVVSIRDLDEFRSSLGVQLPRDEDLLGIIEQMLMDDPIPEGWVLYRTSAGIIRFMNINTQELSFFHPDKSKEQHHIESELRRRNREAMESKYAAQPAFEAGDGVAGGAIAGVGPSPGGSNFEVGFLPPMVAAMDGGAEGAGRGSTGSDGSTSGHPGHSTTGDGDGIPPGVPESPQALFDPGFTNSVVKRMLQYFLKREQERIKAAVAREHQLAAAQLHSSGDEEDHDENDNSDEGEEPTPHPRQGSSGGGNGFAAGGPVGAERAAGSHARSSSGGRRSMTRSSSVGRGWFSAHRPGSVGIGSSTSRVVSSRGIQVAFFDYRLPFVFSPFIFLLYTARFFFRLLCVDPTRDPTRAVRYRNMSDAEKQTNN
eukprot:gene2208-1375_t